MSDRRKSSLSLKFNNWTKWVQAEFIEVEDNLVKGLEAEIQEQDVQDKDIGVQ